MGGIAKSPVVKHYPNRLCYFQLANIITLNYHKNLNYMLQCVIFDSLVNTLLHENRKTTTY
ncbi:MAG: Uncharacterised protein [Formosa sp. Hel1_33_131]|nr:MAG: Uncharacterised protein [Formosa sp. Hel1_33_131]